MMIINVNEAKNVNNYSKYSVIGSLHIVALIYGAICYCNRIFYKYTKYTLVYPSVMIVYPLVYLSPTSDLLSMLQDPGN